MGHDALPRPRRRPAAVRRRLRLHTSHPTVYNGTTAQGLHISFTRTGSAVSDIQFEWSGTCNDGHEHQSLITISGAHLSSGAFSDTDTLPSQGHATVSGTIAGSSATGTLSRTGPSIYGTDCDIAPISWSASR
jgi:hypothetical protein